jgi:NADPH2:quinone reductase
MKKIESEAFFLVKKGQPADAFARRPLELDEPTAHEVIIEAEAFGLNYADVMARRGLYREAPPFPCVIGYEVVGRVSHIGPEVDPALLNQRVLGFCRFGGYAKHVRTFDYATVPVEDQAAGELLALCTQAVTAYYMAEYLSPLRAHDTVLVHAAAGGVGTLLIQLAKLKGAKVIAKIGSDSKAELVRSLGADHVVNYRNGDYAAEVQKILGEARLDVSFNPVAGSTFKKDMALLGSGGRMIVFGGSELSNGKWGVFSALNFLRKMGLVIPVGLMMRSKNILGVNMLKIADNKPVVLQECLHAVVELYRQGKLKPQVGAVYTSDELNIAHSLLESGNSTGKIAVVWK